MPPDTPRPPDDALVPRGPGICGHSPAGPARRFFAMVALRARRGLAASPRAGSTIDGKDLLPRLNRGNYQYILGPGLPGVPEMTQRGKDIAERIWKPAAAGFRSRCSRFPVTESACRPTLR
ncbi:hypothetical protein CBM2615_B80004 [Cupriavidus taiwanensis]|uniref:Uncharacterized protein n=1 Tax=Cupriavidus taiwanensis TaxID=164546 RepID=A0A976B3H5_9BURK|nr:hypothetical protein CBM2614_B80004 [Cupriavidus taiwanensis]SOZ70933.1 hypothetical protein CBM2615_B80004 [Cupriavidus taiwanensis]SOZ73627.1 hypothetical protein CBM2613_B60004 [Cupriavidus taiwanensis]SPA10382.1 hypothetical protein CBM2625_B70004 [Cupriavidus taiwanensis]